MEIEKYKEFTEIAKNNIALMRYLRNFRSDVLTEKYRHIKGCLIFKLSSAKFRIKDAREERNKIRRLKFYKEKEIIPVEGYTRQQFDSCSYGELTYCVTARLQDIREYKDFLNNQEIINKYPVMKAYVVHSLERSEKEIRRLLKMRRVLKKSPYKNWDSRLLTLDMESIEDYSLYNDFVKYKLKEIIK
jgi:hypothetical protein